MTKIEAVELAIDRAYEFGMSSELTEEYLSALKKVLGFLRVLQSLEDLQKEKL